MKKFNFAVNLVGIFILSEVRRRKSEDSLKTSFILESRNLLTVPFFKNFHLIWPNLISAFSSVFGLPTSDLLKPISIQFVVEPKNVISIVHTPVF